MNDHVCKAKRGDLAVVEIKSYVCLSDIPEIERKKRGLQDNNTSGVAYTHVYRIGRVTSVTRKGIVKALVWCDGNAHVECTVKAPHWTYLIPDGDAATIGHDHGEYLTLDQVRERIRPNVRPNGGVQ